jgi:hypothetical protein
VLQYLRSIQSLKSGEKLEVKAVVEGTKVIRRFSPGNLVIGLTTNLTTDIADIEKVKRDKNDKEPTLADLLVATFNSGGGVTFDHSSVDRFGLVKLIGNPPWAKETRFIDNLMQQSGLLFGRGEYFYPSPLFISQVASQYQKQMNGREFGQKAPGAVASHFAGKKTPEFGAYVIVPQEGLGEGQSWEPGNNRSGSGRQSMAMKDFIEGNSLVLPLRNNIEAQLYFLDGIVDAFRTKILESFLNAFFRAKSFSESHQQRELYLPWYQQAVFDHLKENMRISLDALSIDLGHMGAKDGYSKAELRDMIAELSLPKTFDIEIFGRRPYGLRSRRAMAEFSEEEALSSRALVNTEFAEKMREISEEYLADLLAVDAVGGRPSEYGLRQWVENLDARTKEKVVQNRLRFTDELADLFTDYFKRMTSDQVVEFHARDGSDGILSFYDIVRTFLIVVDRAIARLPWGSVNGFLVEGLEALTEEVSLKGRPGVHNLLFSDRSSILLPVSQSHLIQLLNEGKGRIGLDLELAEKSRLRFPSQCELMLSSSEKGASKRKGGRR